MNREEHRCVLLAKYLYAASEAVLRKAEKGKWGEMALALIQAEGLVYRVKMQLWLARFGEVRRGQ